MGHCFSHLQLTDRRKIEYGLNRGDTPKQIAAELHVHVLSLIHIFYLFSVAAGLVGGFAAVLLLSGRRPRRRREGKQSRRKIECSKLVLWAVLCTYFAGFGVGVWAVVLDVSQLGVFLAYVGTPTATVIGFYSWKAKAENVVKIKKANQEETEGMPVEDVYKRQPYWR